MNEISSPNLFFDWKRDRVLWLLVGLAALLGLAYNFVILPGYAPDETRHFAYVKLLVEDHQLPHLLSDGSEYAGAHTLHPPLYYLWLAPFYLLARGLSQDAQYHVLRIGSLILCLVALVLIYQIARSVSPAEDKDSRNFARLATAFVALLPMLGMSAGSVNNDSATLLLSAFFVWLLCKYSEDKTLRSAVVLGIVMATGGWCKLNVLLCAGAALAFSHFAQDGMRALFSPHVWARFAVTIGVAGVLLSPWLWHNALSFGHLVPIPPSMSNPTGGNFSQIFNPDFSQFFALANWGMLATMWSQKDWVPDTIRPIVNCGLFAFVATALVAVVFSAVRDKEKIVPENSNASAQNTLSHNSRARVALWSSCGAFAANWIAVLHGALFLTWGWAEGGRYLLPSIFGIALAVSLGWKKIVGSARLKSVLVVWCVALLMLNAICIYWLLAYLNPTFGPKA